MKRGLLITFEGVEGSGKTTQLALLASRLQKEGEKVISTREPGGTELGEKIRSILLQSSGIGISSWSELFLYLASRAQLLEEVIRPALREGLVVLVDRYLDATVAYQAYGRGLDVDMVRELNRLVAADALPDLTLLLDLEPETGLGRIFAPTRDRLEAEDLAFHRRVREGYLRLSQEYPDRIKVIGAQRPIRRVAAEIWQHLAPIISDRANNRRKASSA